MSFDMAVVNAGGTEFPCGAAVEPEGAGVTENGSDLFGTVGSLAFVVLVIGLIGLGIACVRLSALLSRARRGLTEQGVAQRAADREMQGTMQTLQREVADLRRRLQDESHQRDNLERLRSREAGLLARIARGENMDKILAEVCGFITQDFPEAVVVIMTANTDGTVLTPRIYAAGFPDQLKGLMKQVAVRDGALACGTAAARRAQVIVGDISAHPYFSEVRDAFGKAGLTSCLSSPVLSSEGVLLGTVDAYQSFTRRPTSDMLLLIGECVQWVAVTVTRDLSDIALKQRQGELRKTVDELRHSRDLLEERSRQITRIASDYVFARDEAERANRAKSDFLMMMSHELRTPLNAIIGFSEIIMAKLYGELGDPKYGEYVSDIHASGRHLLGIINDILDLSKIEAGSTTLRLEEFDLAEEVYEAMVMVTPSARDGGVHLVNAVAPGQVRLTADRQRVRQILVNLLANGVKFSAKAAEGRVEVHASILSDGVREVKVSDNGVGIDPEHFNKVLEPFGQVNDAPVVVREGTGLGLPLCKRIMELHGGSLGLQSALGEGTRVILRFPRAASSQQGPMLQPPHSL